jgi:uncharacterized protein YvpB
MQNIFSLRSDIKKIIAAVIIAAILVMAFIVFIRPDDESSGQETPVCESCQTSEPATSEDSESPETANENQAITTPAQTLPSNYLIEMDFATQAPEGDWSEPWQNACEEASIIIVHHYLSGTTLNKSIMKNEILEMVNWQIESWGGHGDLTSEKTIELANHFYEYESEVIYDYDVKTIKSYVAKGIPVVIPTDGKKLKNPNFRNGGPEYHMLVVKGFDSDEFITNDPGTRKGEGYKYKYQTILDSVKNPKGGKKSIFVLMN